MTPRPERDNQILAEILEECAKTLAWLDQLEAKAQRHGSMIQENVKGAQPFVGRARWHYGSYYLWGDVPALMPAAIGGVKVPGMNWSGSDKPGYKAVAFNDSAIKNGGGSWFAVAHNTTSGKGRNPDGRKDRTPRKAAAARVAKIPLPLAQWIGHCYHPDRLRGVA